MRITIFNESEIRQSLTLDLETIDVIAQGFTKLWRGEAFLPPVMRIDIPENRGEVDVKSAYIHGLDDFAIKIASGFLDNNLKGLPTGSGMMVLVSAVTGIPEAVLLDNGYLTDVRTGAAGAIAARYLANQKFTTAGVIGSGAQARFQARALKLVCDFKELLVYGIDSNQVDAYVSEMAVELDVKVFKAVSAEMVVRNSQVVVTTTPAREPYLLPEWLHPGLHITCMGSDAEHKQELHANVFRHVDLIACDSKAQAFRLGELHHALDAGVLSRDDPVIELGALTTGVKSSRQSEDQVTVCDLTGVGVQDTQIARLAYRKAVELGYGITIDG